MLFHYAKPLGRNRDFKKAVDIDPVTVNIANWLLFQPPET